MNASIHRVGLGVATLAVLVTVGGLFVADGYFSARRAPAAAVAVASTSPSTAPTPGATLAPQVIYVRPAPSPKVIHVVVPGTGGEGGDGEHDGGGESDGGD